MHFTASALSAHPPSLVQHSFQLPPVVIQFLNRYLFFADFYFLRCLWYFCLSTNKKGSRKILYPFRKTLLRYGITKQHFPIALSLRACRKLGNWFHLTKRNIVSFLLWRETQLFLKPFETLAAKINYIRNESDASHKLTIYPETITISKSQKTENSMSLNPQTLRPFDNF